MLTSVEIIACRDKLREADVLLSQVRGAFLVAQFMHGARIANDILGLVADLLRELDAMEAMLKQP
ncbi:MAG: hypothetical protein WB610_11470 [Rhodomicrobium sp.]|jgi:hypothetical protein